MSQRHTRQYRALFALLSRPYFERVWVRQEAYFVANVNMSSVFAGDFAIPFSLFRKAFHFLHACNLDFGSPSLRQEQDLLVLAMSICQRRITDVINIMKRMRSCKATDARDIIYSNLGILKHGGWIELTNAITISYSK